MKSCAAIKKCFRHFANATRSLQSSVVSVQYAVFSWQTEGWLLASGAHLKAKGAKWLKRISLIQPMHISLAVINYFKKGKMHRRGSNGTKRFESIPII